MIDSLKGDWCDIFEYRLTALQVKLVENIAKAFKTFTANFTNSILTVSRSLGNPLKRLESNWQSLQTRLESNVKYILQGITEAADDAWKEVQPIVREHLLPGLKECGAQSGKKSFDRCKAIMLAAVKENREVMYDEGSKKILADLSNAVQETSHRFQGETKDVMTQFSSFFNTMLEQNSSGQSRETMRRTVACRAPLGTNELQEAVRKEVLHLNVLWRSIVEITKKEEDEAFADDNCLNNYPESKDGAESDPDFEVQLSDEDQI